MASRTKVDGSGVCAKDIGNVSELVLSMLFEPLFEKSLDGQAPVKYGVSLNMCTIDPPVVAW